MLTTNEETSPTRAADPVYVGIGSTLHTSAGSVAFNGLEKGTDLMLEGQKSKAEKPWQANTDYPTTEAPETAPVAGGVDPHVLCRWCHFQIRFGRDPISYVDRCNLCAIEEVQLA